MREVTRAEAVWIAPPCGTASQARSIPLPSGKGPVPLRSEAHPCGLPNISGIDKERVQAANDLYAFAARVFEFCAANQKVCVIENPTGSLMWLTPWMKHVSNLGIFHKIQNCMCGGARDKRTALFSTHELPSMHLMCDQLHRHAPWGKVRVNGQWQFSTSSEAEYPAPFCAAVATDLCAILVQGGWDMESKPISHSALAAQAVQRQARREAACVGPPEFLSRVTVCVDLDAPVPDPMPESVPQGLLGVPVGSKLLLSRKIKKGDCLVREVTYGIFRTPDEFVKEAMTVRRPFDAPSALDDSNIQAMANILSSGVEATKSFRRQRIEHYRLRAAALQQAEEALKSTMDPEVLSIVSCKRITLFEEMLRDAGVQDQSLVEDLKQGFRLTGELKPSGLFPNSLGQRLCRPMISKLRRNGLSAQLPIRAGEQLGTWTSLVKCGPWSRSRRSG